MKITGISVQKKDTNRLNVFIDGRYRFSLDALQFVELGVKVGAEVTPEQLEVLEQESGFGKLYVRALDYCLMRPRSQKEVREYLQRKTRATRTKLGTMRPGATTETVERVFARLLEKGYLDDEKFTRYWLENRRQKKGASRRKLEAELLQKGISRLAIDRFLDESDRTDEEEIKKIIAKKERRYPDEQKLMAYLARQGFGFDTIRRALDEES